jgi:hypothetical protein
VEEKMYISLLKFIVFKDCYQMGLLRDEVVDVEHNLEGGFPLTYFIAVLLRIYQL